jgi:hypothetical protein
VDQENNEFVVRLEPSAQNRIPEAIIRVAQACIRVADLSFMQRFPITTEFRDDVEEFIHRNELSYEPEISLPGKYGREVPLDFRVRGPQKTSLIRALSTGNPASAHAIMNETLACWVDLELYRANHQFVTVIDDRENIYRQADLERIAAFSNLVGFPSQQEQLKNLLAA